MQDRAKFSRIEAVLLSAVILIALILRWQAFSPFEISHADELMQYLEQAKRLATGNGIIPWEYRFGARNGIVPQLLSLPWWIGTKLAPGTLAPMLITRWFFLSLSLLSLPAAWILGALISSRHAFMALFAAAIWYEAVLFSTLLLSEVLATSLILLGSALLLKGKLQALDNRNALFIWAGFLLGLGVLMRLQYAPFVAMLTLLVVKNDWRYWKQIILGGLAAAIIGAISDLGMGQAPFAWILQNFSYNISAGRAARFGEESHWFYLKELLVHLGPAAFLILFAAFTAPKSYRPLLWALAANVSFHSVFAHKEYRFIWLSVFFIVLLAAISSVTLLEKVLTQRWNYQMSAKAMGLLCLLWLGLSASAEQGSGGARVMRGGAPIPLAGLDAAKLPQTCGIMLPDQWRAHLVTSLMPREVPLYIAPKAILKNGEALPTDLTDAANAVIWDKPPHTSKTYQLISCHHNTMIKACLYLRDGNCRPSKYWLYQSALEREGL